MRILFGSLIVMILCGLTCSSEEDWELKELVSDLRRNLMNRRFQGYNNAEAVALRRYLNRRRLRPLYNRDEYDNRRGLEKRKLECDTPLEIAFILDESGSIWNPHFIDQLNFVNDIIDVFKVDKDGTHIAVMTFANTTNVVLTLGKYVDDVETMKSVISNITQQRGQTRTDLALEQLRTKLLSPAYARPGIPHIAIIITDGASEYAERTLRQARLAKDQGITIFAIGVGRSINLAELKEVATSEKYVFEVKSYDKLVEKLIDDLPDAACEVTTLPPPTTTTTIPTTTTTKPPQMLQGCDGTKPLDVMFAAPDEAGIRDTEITLDFIQDIVKGFNISDRHVQVGMTPRFCRDLDGITLNKHDVKAPLLNDIENRNLQSTLLSQQLDFLLNEAFIGEAGDRRVARDVAILIVDNQAARPGEVIDLARKAEDDGISLIVVGVGDLVDKGLLKTIAKSEKLFFHVDHYESLGGLTTQIHDALCREASSSL